MVGVEPVVVVQKRTKLSRYLPKRAVTGHMSTSAIPVDIYLYVGRRNGLQFNRPDRPRQPLRSFRQRRNDNSDLRGDEVG